MMYTESQTLYYAMTKVLTRGIQAIMLKNSRSIFEIYYFYPESFSAVKSLLNDIDLDITLRGTDWMKCNVYDITLKVNNEPVLPFSRFQIVFNPVRNEYRVVFESKVENVKATTVAGLLEILDAKIKHP